VTGAGVDRRDTGAKTGEVIDGAYRRKGSYHDGEAVYDERTYHIADEWEAGSRQWRVGSGQ
jgi:hypothetical protein